MFKTLIQADELADRVAQGGAVILDCRADLVDPDAGRQAYLAGHIPGAVHLDLARDLSGPAGRHGGGRHPLPDRATLAATLAAAGVGEGIQVVAYDDAGGAYAARAWWLLRWLGHEAVALLDGGLPAWTAAGGMLEQGEARPRTAGSLTAGPEPEGWIATGDVIADALGTDALLVIDARAADRFAGAPNPLDPRPGHVPGARNRPYRDSLGPDGRFKPAGALRRDYAAVLGGTPAEHAVLQCGSGVTACHSLLAMAVAGLPGARLYPGSWSEWASDPHRPVAGGDPS